MLGAVIGDIVGSRFEFVEDENRGKNFALFFRGCKVTDDSLMTIAIAKAVSEWKKGAGELGALSRQYMREIAKANPDVKWGRKFYFWAFVSRYSEPYQSFGNGSAMRVSPVGWVAQSLEEVKQLSKAVTEVTHNHPLGLKGAEAVAVAIYLAREGASKDEIRKVVADEYYPILNEKNFTIEWLQSNYGYDEVGDFVTCEGSVPHAIVAFLESENFEDAIRNAVSIGGDSDTLGAIAGSIAEAYYGLPTALEQKAMEYLTDELKQIYYQFKPLMKERTVRGE